LKVVIGVARVPAPSDSSSIHRHLIIIVYGAAITSAISCACSCPQSIEKRVVHDDTIGIHLDSLLVAAETGLSFKEIWAAHDQNRNELNVAVDVGA